MKPSPEAKQSVVSLSSLKAASSRLTSWNIVIIFQIKRRFKIVKKSNSESTKADPKDWENTYGIDHLKIGEATPNSDDSKWLIAQLRIGQMKNKVNNEKSLTHECNVLSNILNPM